MLSARGRPALPLGALRARGLAVEIGHDELRLDEAEAHQLLSAAGLDLTPAEVAELTERTEGWCAGLYLAALSAKRNGAAGAIRFRGDDRFVAEYLRSEVLSRAAARRTPLPDPYRGSRAHVGLSVRRRAGLERLGGGVGVARTLEPVRRPAGQQRALVSLPPSLQGAAPRGARACRAGSRAAAAGSRGRLERSERTDRGGDRLCPGRRRRRPGVAAGRAMPSPRIRERSFRGRRGLARLAGGARGA